MIRYPHLVGDTWFNTKPLSPKDLEGKVVLFDFWTYSCAHCLRSLPYIKKWWEKYKDRGCIIIGIHAPEFIFEKDVNNVQKAIIDLGITWPIILDNELINWHNFANKYWPAKYLVDIKGHIVYSHFGEGEYEETEKAIQDLLGGKNMPSVEKEKHEHGQICFRPTPELYCGYSRGWISSGIYEENKIKQYNESGVVSDDSIALKGKFLATPEYIESKEKGAELIVHFQATEVNLVMESRSKNAIAQIELNGNIVTDEYRGRDVNSKGEVHIQKPSLYNLLKSNNLMEGILRIRAFESDFRAYAFTFLGCADL